MDIASEMRRCLVDLDVVGVKKVWKFVAPHLPQPKTNQEALTALHAARTAAESVPFKLRAYSHRWLTEQTLPSFLPDRLKPRAERLYPKIVDGVGISVGSKYPVVATAVRGAMEYAVEDCYANGDKEPEIVKPRMFEAKRQELKGLGLLRRGE